MRYTCYMKVRSFKFYFIFLLLHFISFAALATEADDVEYSGDVYHLPSMISEMVVEAVKNSGGDCYYHRGNLYLLVYPEDFDIYGVIEELLQKEEDVDREYKQRERESNWHIKKQMRARRDKLRGELFPRNLRKNYPTMQLARSAFGADRIYSGEDLPGKFDGSGVVIGFSDIGFDANHPNFLTADGRESRVKLFVNYDLKTGRRTILETPEQIRSYATDRADNYHATHVGGIMGGRGTLNGEYAGMAPGADIVATTSSMHDVEILAGVEDIIAYAKSQGKPAVINLSLGSYGGPHDGTSLFSQYLDMCAEDAIICLSTGNEGEQTNHIGFTFTEDKKELLFRPSDCTWDYVDIDGSTDIYANDATPMKLSMRVQDTATSGRPTVFATPMINFEETPIWILTSDKELAEAYEECHYDEEFAKYFTGLILLTGEVDPYNGRYHVRAEWAAHTDIMYSDTKHWGRYQLAGVLEAPTGTSVNLYADGIRSSFQAGGTVKADSENSFSDLCSGYKVISVGAYNITRSVLTMGGIEYKGGEPYSVCGFSSYGATPDGRIIPHTIAPGAPIVSSYSGFYVEENGTRLCVFKNDDAYWGVENGTSMSCPYVAGGIAVWLQADPSMKHADVESIMEASNRKESFETAANPRNGRGAFDPYAGLQLVIKRASTSVDEILGNNLTMDYHGGVLEIFNPENNRVKVEVYSLSGIKMASVDGGDAAMIKLYKDNLNLESGNGVAICRVSTEKGNPVVMKITY